MAGPSSLPARLLIGACGAVGLNVLIAVIAQAAGASEHFSPLRPAAYVTFTIVGFAVGAAGWTAIMARATNPGRILRVLVPSVLALSFIPDLAVGLGDRPGTSWGAVAALMAMHVVVAVTLVHAFWPKFRPPALSPPAQS